jgi:hypothetical protein
MPSIEFLVAGIGMLVAIVIDRHAHLMQARTLEAQARRHIRMLEARIDYLMEIIDPPRVNQPERTYCQGCRCEIPTESGQLCPVCAGGAA